ncbi:MAG: glycosyltransferase [Proteobacteria bacterium]|nr:glycosyltransferase [Desulfobacteraceae bacterium]MBU3980010.1 glycosyltransferase [Pseudomonadota bacterium]MBU4012516.1 glycosyltransferase [Pseudomonadota bacterium]MBU4068515.1 glycosyltransferase [Pseudomonadota bacterium]MBU4099949.1 glycosyltransferase [Pseudomonadota bacterium]
MCKKKENQLVSVIIPTYNRGWAIKEAIDSVLAQDFTDFELIVVDDGSTDNTQDILNSYKEDIIVLHQENKGVSAARNRGIASASGQYIAFLDSDDLWLPQKLSTQVDFFNTNPDALICQTEEKWIRNGMFANPKKRHRKLSGNIFEQSLYLCLVSPSAVMMKRSLFEKAGMFDETLSACEDYDMWLRVSCRYPVYLIDTPLIIKRGGHADQLSRTSGQDRYRIQSLKKIIESNLLTDEQTMSALKVLKEKCAIYANGCLKRGRKDKALHYNDLAESCLGR